MKIAKKKVRMQTPIVNAIINLERPLEKVLKTGEYIAIKCHTTLEIITQDFMRLTFLTMEEEHLKSDLSGNTNYSRP